MSFLLTHLISVIMIAVVIAGLGTVWAFVAKYNASKRDVEMQKMQDKACENCSLASMCTRFGTGDRDCEVHDKKEEYIEA